MSFLLIPKRYRHPIIVAALFRKYVQWNFRDIKAAMRSGKIANWEIEEEYFELERAFSNLQNFCQRIPYKFVIKQCDEVITYSDGPEILFNADKAAIYFDRVNFYYIPPGIKTKSSDYKQTLPQMGIDPGYWFMTYWQNKTLSFENMEHLEELFQIRIRVWSRFESKASKRHIYEKLYNGNRVFDCEKNLHYQPETETFLFIDDKEKYFEKLFQCSTKNCLYTFRTKKLLEAHESLCGQENTVIQQTEYENSRKLLERAENHGLIPKCGVNRNYLFFDIESVLPSSNVRTQKTVVLSSHKLVSLAVNRYFLSLPFENHKIKFWTFG